MRLNFAARRVVDAALHAAINARRPFSWYFAGFPEPRRNPYSW